MEDKLQDARHKFFFETALYTDFPTRKDDKDEDKKGESKETFDIEDLLYGEVDAYNTIDKKDTTFEIRSSQIESYGVWKEIYRVELECRRTGQSFLFLVVKNDEGTQVRKIGQLPSLADIQLSGLDKKYKGVLADENLSNFKKGIECNAHSFGAGSFTYLRRVFENLVLESFGESQIDLSEEKFREQRMESKIETLKDYLPQQLVEMKPIFKILSKGVHELTEEECNQFFPALKLAIELILDEKKEKVLKLNREKAVKDQLKRIGTIVNSEGKALSKIAKS